MPERALPRAEGTRGDTRTRDVETRMYVLYKTPTERTSWHSTERTSRQRMYLQGSTPWKRTIIAGSYCCVVHEVSCEIK